MAVLSFRAGAPLRAVAVMHLLALGAGCAEPLATEPRVSESSLLALEQAVPEPARRAYLEDAHRLALREMARARPLESHPVEIAGDTVRSLYHALLAVYAETSLPARDSVVERHDIHAFPNPPLRELIVAVHSDAPWLAAWREGRTETGHAAVDDLLRRYELRLQRFYDWSIGPAAVLESAAPLNQAALAKAFSSVAGVRHAEPNGAVGDGNDIRARRSGAGWRLAYSVGYGDCPAGCIHRRGWVFQVSDAGTVQYLGVSGGAP